MTGYQMPSYLQKNFTYLYKPVKTGLDTLININGYYTEIEIETHRNPKGFLGNEWEYTTDTSHMNCLFFDDGIVLYNMFASHLTSYPNLSAFLTNLAKDTSDSKYLYGMWGTYVVKGDTIRIQTIHPCFHFNINDSWNGCERHFKIIDKTTLKLIYVKPMYMSESDKKIYTEQFYSNSIKDENPYKFIPSEAIPSSDCWLKEQECIWKDKQDYLEFMNKKRPNKSATGRR